MIKEFYLRKYLIWVLPLSIVLSSCFTGIEGTKKITLTHGDRKMLQPTQEEIFFQGIQGDPVSKWDEGHQFYVTDNKALLIFEPHAVSPDMPTPELGGDTIRFTGVESRINPAGEIVLVIDFTDGNIKLPYNTNRIFQDGLEQLRSDQIPMLIDLKLVEKAKELIKGKKIWTRTLLWYDKEGNRIDGYKFIPVLVEDVSPGNFVFPLKVKIKDEDGREAWFYMNYGSSGNESRSFAHLFSLTDPRHNYPSITDETWKLICRGDVATGMTKEECKLALGNPSDISSGHDYSQTLDIWNYENGIVLWFEDGLLTRYRK